MTDNFGQSPQSIASLLLYGSEDSRLSWARALVSTPDRPLLDVLADTALSSEHWLLRARCLEVLGLVAANAPRPLAENILDRLAAGAQPRHAPPTHGATSSPERA